MAARDLRWITPSLVAVAVALLGLLSHDVGKLQDNVTEVRERLARVEAVLGVKPAGKGVLLPRLGDIQAASAP